MTISTSLGESVVSHDTLEVSLTSSTFGIISCASLPLLMNLDFSPFCAREPGRMKDISVHKMLTKTKNNLIVMVMVAMTEILVISGPTLSEMGYVEVLYRPCSSSIYQVIVLK